jgi:hypothetical protein
LLFANKRVLAAWGIKCDWIIKIIRDTLSIEATRRHCIGEVKMGDKNATKRLVDEFDAPSMRNCG